MILDLLKKRCSVREYTNDRIDDSIINYILECGRLSPSGGNEQAWKFGAITDKDLIKEISKATYYNEKWIANSPLLIILCTRLFPDVNERQISCCRFPSLEEEIKDVDNELYININLEENQIKIPGTHMVLAAMEHCIGSTWVSYLNCERVGEIIGLKGYIASQIIAFGYPKNEMKPRSKKNFEDIMFYDYYK